MMKKKLEIIDNIECNLLKINKIETLKTIEECVAGLLPITLDDYIHQVYDSYHASVRDGLIYEIKDIYNHVKDDIVDVETAQNYDELKVYGHSLVNEIGCYESIFDRILIASIIFDICKGDIIIC